jgi:cytoskeleton-associated protein 5
MDGEPPEEADFSKLSIEDCLAHKNWRARVSAYDRLAAQFRLSPAEDAPCFRPYLRDPDLLKRAVTDSNVAAQEKGVECVCAFVEFAGKSAVASRDAVVTGLVDKCLGSTRASIKTKAIELCELYTEVEGTGSNIVVRFPSQIWPAVSPRGQPVILEGLKAKQPKVVAASVMALRELVRRVLRVKSADQALSSRSGSSA